ncbi:hypothetical protein [Salipiger bermudensis]|uniref:Uncharacterized protein n=1 Tax=Salipiger bermudensis (strain DSM 26914 / JCM 13377 / KCTC 12554 / HTCC2601) TaxID=314265 RepID=Q0FH85_SALBH|nr:hypothetical protein [Salipiger bermudensis]EAU43566.1 hypothetical protein R2601_24095 [Salipiger bermudensis HTCC2601]
MMADLPRADRDATGWVMTDAALARLKCQCCGWRGPPAEIRFGWSAGLPSQSDRNTGEAKTDRATIVRIRLAKG